MYLITCTTQYVKKWVMSNTVFIKLIHTLKTDSYEHITPGNSYLQPMHSSKTFYILLFLITKQHIPSIIYYINSLTVTSLRISVKKILHITTFNYSTIYARTRGNHTCVCIIELTYDNEGDKLRNRRHQTRGMFCCCDTSTYKWNLCSDPLFQPLFTLLWIHESHYKG